MMLVQQANGSGLRVVVITRIGFADLDIGEARLIQQMPRQFRTRSRKIRPLDTVCAQGIANVDLRAKDESKKGACAKGEENRHGQQDVPAKARLQARPRRRSFPGTTGWKLMKFSGDGEHSAYPKLLCAAVADCRLV